MSNKTKIYLFAVLLMISAFFLTSKTIKGLKNGDFDVVTISIALVVLLVSIFYILKFGKIENNK